MRIGIAIAAVVLAYMSPRAAARPSAAFKGRVALATIKVDTCSYSQNGTDLSIVRCTEPGVFKSSGGGATARYNWTWSLVLNNGAVSGNGTEAGRLTLTFKAGALVLLTVGRTQSSGSPGSLKTTGKWRVASGTGTYARATGSGSFVFVSLENRSVRPPTRAGSITISGAVS